MSRFIGLTLIIVGIVLAGQAIILSAYMSFNVGIIASFILGLCFMAYGLLFPKIQKLTQKGWPRIIKYLIFVCFGIFLCILVLISFYGQNDTATYQEDALIILGAGIDGETPRLPLRERLKKGAAYYEKNPKVMIVVSGGRGAEEDITEALAMERYLVSAGVPESHILKEERSTSTYENFVYSKGILDNYFNRPYSTVFITNGFHIFRANQIARIAGLDCTTLHAEIIWYSIPVIYIRESMAVMKLLILRE